MPALPRAAPFLGRVRVSKIAEENVFSIQYYLLAKIAVDTAEVLHA